MNHPVISALLPVVILIAVGFAAGRAQLMKAESVKDLSKLVFTVFLPPMLFRATANLHPENMQLKPLLAYLLGMSLMYAFSFMLYGRNRRAAVLGLAASFSNTVMIGIALIGFAYGEQGVGVLLSLVAVHSLIMLSGATVILEWVSLREKSAHEKGVHQGEQGVHPVKVMFGAVANTLKQPMIWPIVLGLCFAQTGWSIPSLLDKPLQLIGAAFSPLALILVGISLAGIQIGQHIKLALQLSALKNIGHPLAVALIGQAFGLVGLPLTVMVVTASIPIGANVFLFAQRYDTALQETTAAVAVSSVLALISVAVALSAARWLG